MLKINLVPYATKKETGLKQTYGALKIMNYTLIFLSILISAIFMSSQFFLAENSGQTHESNDLPLMESGLYDKRPREINNKLKNLEEILKDNYSNLEIIKDLNTKIPNGISLARLKINMEKKQIDIIGQADLRDTLLELKENLENDKLYTKINFPLENILKKENINFNITVNINPEILLEKM